MMTNTSTGDGEKPDMARIAGQIKAYAETKADIVTLTLAGKSARTLSRVSTWSIFGLLLLLGIVFGSCALSLLIYELTGRASLAFLSVAFLYFFAAVIYRLFFSRKVEARLGDWYVKQILGNEQQRNK